MTTIIWLTFGTAVGVASPLVLWRMRCNRNKAKRTLARSRKPYAAVSIDPCLMACNAVNRVTGKRFLQDEVPSLPLAACDSDRCQCRYKYYSDRRESEDRRLPFGDTLAIKSADSGNERRKSTDRRVSNGENVRAAPAYFNNY